MASTQTISRQLLVRAGGALVVTLLVATALLSWRTADRQRTLVLREASSRAETFAQTVARDMDSATSIAKTMVLGIASARESGEVGRQTVVNMLRDTLEGHPNVFGAWFAEAPGGFDGVAGEAGVGLAGSNAKGVFTPYWTRGRGGVEFSTFEADYAAPWWALAADSRNGAVTEPYVASEVNELMTSFAIPMRSNGGLIGVGGVDISMAQLSQALSTMRPLETGRVRLLSASGAWLVAPTPAQLMQPYDGPMREQVLNAIKTRTSILLHGVETADGMSVYRLVQPFEIAGLNTTWAVLVDIPVSGITGPVIRDTVLMVAGGAIVLAIVLAALFTSVQRIVRTPIDGLLQSISRLLNAEYHAKVPDQDRGDEIGAVARALETFRGAALEKIGLEAEAQRQRSAAEAERAAVEADRKHAAEQLAMVVRSVGEALDRLADGDLTHRIRAEFPPQYQALKTNLHKAIDTFHDAVRTIADVTQAIGTGTSEIAQASDDLSRRTEHQAATLEETVAAFDQITEAVQQTARDGAKANDLVIRTTADADGVSVVVREAVAAMHGIKTSSDQISRINGVIEGISFQTNLLALNASVEAARAGEAGKGFAVVAAEVRLLAQRSAEAAKEIEGLIRQSTEQVADGVALVDRTGESLNRIIAQVQDISGIVSNISDSAQAQAHSLTEINVAMNAMDKTTQQNAAMVEQSTAAARSLAGETDELVTLVAKFRVGGDGARAFARAS